MNLKNRYVCSENVFSLQILFVKRKKDPVAV